MSKLSIFGLYSFSANLLYVIMQLLLPQVRSLLFKFLFCKIGKEVYIDYLCYFRYYKKIIIGNNVTINRGCKFFASHYIKDSYIYIGNNVAFGPNVTVYSAGHDYSSLNLPDTASSVSIEDNVWIGGSSIILPGVRIGEGAVIGAGSVVTKEVPAYSIAVGNPARVIKKRILKEQVNE